MNKFLTTLLIVAFATTAQAKPKQHWWVAFGMLAMVMYPADDPINQVGNASPLIDGEATFEPEKGVVCSVSEIRHERIKGLAHREFRLLSCEQKEKNIRIWEFVYCRQNLKQVVEEGFVFKTDNAVISATVLCGLK